MTTEFQLRGGDLPEKDTGELFLTEDAAEALNRFILGSWWKLSFRLSNGRRVRLLKVGDRDIKITYMDEIVKDAFM
jgi:hypothetical protein